MKVFLTGASGFVGQEIGKRLAAAGHEVRCLIHNSAQLPTQFQAVQGDILDKNSLVSAMQGCDAVVHLVGIIREAPQKGATFQRIHVEGTKNMVDAAREVGISRFLQMSALGARPGATSPYHQTKWDAEEYVRGSGLEWTVFRPSVIFGPGDGFVSLLADVLKRAPLFPIFGHGQFPLSPVALIDVAEGFVRALAKPETVGQAYEVGGPEAISYRDVIACIGQVVGKKRVRTFTAPIPLVRPVVSLLEGFSFFPITSAMLTMLVEGNACDSARFAADFELTLTPFRTGISYVNG
ncbi:nucleoside-diphosphate sugar epimerase [Tumebacillus algifaecis]|uniref:Nucleoside-diphosphate sugar epimerase n=1 Tax=Tumebacillus algifaecis TaxID=1214604 RepID=A0A223CYM2_9BACL|nr:complex I NDUFA9 subunit family protein [Tumebacillus algifaecis]ASS74448.1 nucleoside-diphosphate sugar epimerase [Tumebacillus algifaecis]